MKKIIAIIVGVAVCGTLYAEKGDTYAKGSLGVLNVSADLKVNDTETFGEGEEYDDGDLIIIIPPGFSVNEYFSLESDLEGTGFLLEVGGGYEVIDSLRLEGSLGFGMASVDADSFTSTDSIEVKENGVVIITEGPFSDQVSEKIETDISTFIGMIDANYVFTDLFMKDSDFSAFAGFGIGFAMNTVDDTTITDPHPVDGGVTTLEGDSSASFAWRFNLGAGYAFNDQWSLNLVYQYMDLGTAEGTGKGTWNGIDGSTDAFTLTSAPEYELSSHVFSLGAMYTF